MLEALVEDLTKDIRSIYSIKNIESFSDINKYVKDIGGLIKYTDKFDESGKVCRVGDKFIIYIRTDERAVNEKYYENKMIYNVLKGLAVVFLIMQYQIDNEYFLSIDEDDLIDGIVYSYKDRCIEPSLMHRFAQAFLMPKEEYIKIVSENTKDSMVKTIEVAKYFKVNLDIAILRGQCLEVLAYEF